MTTEPNDRMADVRAALAQLAPAGTFTSPADATAPDPTAQARAVTAWGRDVAQLTDAAMTRRESAAMADVVLLLDTAADLDLAHTARHPVIDDAAAAICALVGRATDTDDPNVADYVSAVATVASLIADTDRGAV